MVFSDEKISDLNKLLNLVAQDYDEGGNFKYNKRNNKPITNYDLRVDLVDRNKLRKAVYAVNKMV